MTNKTTVDIWWDKGGRISYSVSGSILPPPRDNEKLYVLAPSALFLLAHQFGSMKPSHGLITCGTVIDMLYDKRYVLMPINSALKGAMIDLIYAESSIKVQFHPKHGLFANSDSLEEGVRQLLNNYIHYVYTEVDEYAQSVLTTMASFAIVAYLDFIEEELRADSIGKDKDVWSMSFPLASSRLVAWLSQKYYVPPYGTSAENQKWMKAECVIHEELRPKLESRRSALFAAMGLN
jgi:hypothetical protein